MKINNILYENKQQVKNWISNLNLVNNKSCHFQIHTSSLSRDECVELAIEIKSYLPLCTVAGFSVSGLIYNGEILDSGVLISAAQSEYGSLEYVINSTLGKTAEEVALSISEYIIESNSDFGVFAADYLNLNLTQVTEQLNSLIPNTTFVGGIAGTMLPTGEIDSFLFDDKGCYENSYFLFYSRGNRIFTYSNIITGHPSISKSFTITKAHNEYVDEIDGYPATEWLYDKLGIDNLTENYDWENTVASDILLRFPLVLDKKNSSTRFLQYEKATNSLKTYYSYLKEGQKFSIGYLSDLYSVEQWQNIYHDLQKVSAEFAFCYSCLFRKLFANNISKWEMSALKNIGICGAFMLGEIGTSSSQIQALNGACSIFTLAEKENYIKLDISEFGNVDNLIESNANIIEQIKKVATKLETNNDIFQNMLEYEEKIRARNLYVEEDNFFSMKEFLFHQSEKLSNQLCLISMSNEDKHLSVLGKDNFDKFAKENMFLVKDFLLTEYNNLSFKFFKYDSGNFLFLIEDKISSADFIEIAKNLYLNRGANNLLNETTACINNFIITLDGKQVQSMIAIAHNNEIPTTKRRFFICDETDTSKSSLHEEFTMVTLLNTIIKEDAIVPYFQGIYDNENNSFFAYESLMRLQCPNGRMLFPAEFMDIAKKYNLYSLLSIGMINKVFQLFYDRDEVVTINISALDVESEEFRNLVYEHLKNTKKPYNFIFELVESEEFDNLDVLNDFINHIRKLNCKVASDDFGSGYSNFIEFGKIKFDYLKINGSLTKSLGTALNYDHILDSISYMSKKMDVKLIAEYVETASQHRRLVQGGVQYSQGYLFSRPMPFSELEIVSTNNLKKNSEKENAPTQKAEFGLYTTKNIKVTNIFLGLGVSIGLIGIGVYITNIKNIFAPENFLMLIILLINLAFLITNMISAKKGENRLTKELNAIQAVANSLQRSIEVDSLTSTFSRATIAEKISQVLMNTESSNTLHAVSIIDVDNFKHINDKYGHLSGDIYLQNFANAIKFSITDDDILGRLGGDEFILLLKNVKTKENATNILNTIFEKVNQIELPHSSLETVGISAGVILTSGNKYTYDDILHNADIALYEAKNSGKNKFLFYEN